MDRRQKVLHHINPDGLGLEIGPSHNPDAPKSEGFNVEIIDHLDEDGLREKYAAHGLDVSRVEEVDYVWNGEPYGELTGKTKYYDWVIASHLIEHTPDLVAFLQNCDEVLKDDGVLSLVVPDKRFCFDRFRPLTGLGGVLDAHDASLTSHTDGTISEFFMNSVSADGATSWGPETIPNEFELCHTAEELEAALSMAKRGEYVDVHSWCFTPSSFRLIVEDLWRMGLSPLRELGHFDTTGCEFYVTLGRSGNGPGVSRLELLQQAEREGWPAESVPPTGPVEVNSELEALSQEISAIRSTKTYRMMEPVRRVERWRRSLRAQ